MATSRIPTSVYAEMTPNPAVMKFVADRKLVPGQEQLEFRSKAEAMLCSPLATELFNFPFVTNVFISGSVDGEGGICGLGVETGHRGQGNPCNNHTCKQQT